MTITLNKNNNNNNNYRVCERACLYVRWRWVTLKSPGDGDLLWLSIGWLWDVLSSKYLKCIVDDSVIVCDKLINARDSVSTNVTNTISTNVTSTVPINSDDEKVRYKMDCYNLHTLL